MASRISELRDELGELFSGERTLGDSAVPPIVFVTVNAFVNLAAAAVSALLVGVAITVFRLRRGGPDRARVRCPQRSRRGLFPAGHTRQRGSGAGRGNQHPRQTTRDGLDELVPPQMAAGLVLAG